MPQARDAADRVRRARLPRRVGLEGLPRDGRGLRPSPSRGTRRVGSAPGADLHPRDQGPDRPRREHRPRRRGRARRREPVRRGRADHARALPLRLRAGRCPRDHPRRHEARVRHRRAGEARARRRGIHPDSSRFWPADEYAPGGAQPSFDKQFVRDYCETLGWGKTYPGPELPASVVEGTRARYVEAFEKLTGLAFADYLADPEILLR